MLTILECHLLRNPVNLLSFGSINKNILKKDAYNMNQCNFRQGGRGHWLFITLVPKVL